MRSTPCAWLRCGRRRPTPPAARIPRPARGHRDDPLYRARRLLGRDFTTLTERQSTRLENALVPGDRSGQLTQAWIVGQERQLLYRRSHDLAEARHRLWKILDRCAGSKAPSYCGSPHAGHLATRAARGVHPGRQAPRQQRPYRGRQRADQEGGKVSHGFRNLENYGLRLLLAAVR
jgi:hypothetical protein